jgi:hypothetical protein
VCVLQLSEAYGFGRLSDGPMSPAGDSKLGVAKQYNCVYATPNLGVAAILYVRLAPWPDSGRGADAYGTRVMTTASTAVG